MKLHNLRKQANEQGFTLIELMIVIAIIGILAAVAIPNFIEYKNKSYCTATVNDVGAIGGALADYFANPMNVSASTSYKAADDGARPYLVIGGPDYDANTLLLSASTSAGDTGVDQAAGALKSGSNYAIYAIEGTGNCPIKITESDTHWIDPTKIDVANKSIDPAPRANADAAVAYFKTL